MSRKTLLAAEDARQERKQATDIRGRQEGAVAGLRTRWAWNPGDDPEGCGAAAEEIRCGASQETADAPGDRGNP